MKIIAETKKKNYTFKKQNKYEKKTKKIAVVKYIQKGTFPRCFLMIKK